MAPRGSQRSSVSTKPDVSDKTAPNEGQRQLRPLDKALNKQRSVAGGRDSIATSKAQNAREIPSSRKGPLKKSVSTIEDKAKSNERSIHSFFNAATQKQQGSRHPTSPEKLPSLQDEIENIEDDIDGEIGNGESSQTTLSKGSSTALAARKRKFDRANSLDQPLQSFRHASQKFRKTSNGDRAPASTRAEVEQSPWTDRFAPSDLSELAVHKRKVADVRGWLSSFYQGRRQKILILKGAAGTGKTATVRLLAKDLDIDLIEYKASTAFDAASETPISASSQFEEFVTRAGKGQGLDLSIDKGGEIAPSTLESAPTPNDASRSRQQALLVEEFPNTFSKTASALLNFRATLAQYVMFTAPLGAPPIPIIMVISETLLSTNTASADSFTAHRLLGPELVTNPYVNTIEFNPVAPTILIKALETIVVKEARKSGRRKTPGPEILKRLAESGDIRSAVSSLEFLCVRGDEGDWSAKVAFTKPKQARAPAPPTKAEEEALKLISNRENSLGIFHSVGKVVYNKRTDRANGTEIAQPPPWLSQHHRMKIAETDPNTLIDELGTDTSTFIAALHENYALSCAAPSAEQRLDSLLGCMQNLSDSDLLSLDRFSMGTRAFSGSATDTLRQDEMCFQVAVRGLLFSLPYPVHRSEASSGKRGDAHRMFYPASLRLWRKREEVETALSAIIDKVMLSTMSAEAVSNASGTGVENWTRRTSGSQPTGPSSTDGGQALNLTSQAKIEMLLDRLPYISQILSSNRGARAQHNLQEQITLVTKIDHAALPASEEEDEEAEDRPDALEVDAAVDQWSTDRPEGPNASPSKSRSAAARAGIVVTNVALPVERRVQSLVLEDDDIED